MSEVGFGVIGVGTWGQLHARVYASTRGVRLAAVCDTNAERAGNIAGECGGAAVYADYRELLADPAVSAVSIVLPDFLHRDAVLAAAQAGKHILVEKPLATTEAEGRAMIEAARAAGVRLFVDFHNRWSPLFAPLKQALDAGDLGAPRHIYSRLSDTVFVPKQMLAWAARSSVAWFLASHCLDTLLWLMGTRGGGDRPIRLYCVKREGVLRDLHGVDTPDSYHTTIEWASGLVTTLENSWLLPESSPSIFDLRFELVGTKGAYRIDGSHHGAAQQWGADVRYHDAIVAPTILGRPSGFAADAIRDFTECVIDGRTPVVDGLDGLAVTRLVLAMEDSARLGRPVTIAELFGE